MKRLTIILVAVTQAYFITNVSSQSLKGNGNVVEKERSIEDFTKIEVKEGIDLTLKQGESIHLTVTADENLHDAIITEVVNGTLKIYPKVNIQEAKKMQVDLTFIEIESLAAAEGSDVMSLAPLKLENLAVACDEGSDLQLNINATKLVCAINEGSDAKVSGIISNVTLVANEGSDISMDITSGELICTISEGSDAILKGICKTATMSANEGSDINAFGLEVENCRIVAEEGSDAEVFVTKSLIVVAKGGSDIAFKGNPTQKQISSCEECDVSSR